MSDYNFRSEPSSGSRDERGVGKAANEALSQAGHIAHQAADKAREAASNTAATVSNHVKELLDRQVSSGADVMGHVAHSAKRAADDLEQNAPQLAGVVRTVADRIDGYAGGLRGRSADELIHDASDFARRQPGVVFGLAAVAAFLALRAVKSSSTPSASSDHRTWSE